MQKRISITLAVIVVVLLAAGFMYTKWSEEEYVAVYMSTGDLYFGKFDRFPTARMTDVWYLRRGADGQVSLDKFSESFWEPGNKMLLNEKQIVWVSPLDFQGAIAKVIRGEAQATASPTPLFESLMPTSTEE